ncbi:Integral membrane protein [metagenome]|uniref:Integral membrane protein n=1 Tax=metagenome TaxID=256318 RepID=A0A2P2C4J9_9ZZZZ
MIRTLLLDPPLTPSPDDARSSLRRELLKPEYNDQNLVQRLLDGIQRLLDRAVDAASSASLVQTLVAMVALVAIVGAAVWLVTRARTGARHRPGAEPVLPPDEHATGAELRARAESALEQGRHAQALVDGFRALTLHQIEGGRLVDAPGATAREVARSLATTYPAQGERVSVTAGRFDSVLYGDRPATADQARDVLVLDDELRGRR